MYDTVVLTLVLDQNCIGWSQCEISTSGCCGWGWWWCPRIVGDHVDDIRVLGVGVSVR